MTTDPPTLDSRTNHAKWVLYCLTESSDFDWLPGDTREGMAAVAEFAVEMASEVATLRAENGVMAEVLDALDRATRLPLGKSPFDVGFVWAQNREALLEGTTTWADQFGAASVSSEGA